MDIVAAWGAQILKVESSALKAIYQKFREEYHHPLMNNAEF